MMKKDTKLKEVNLAYWLLLLLPFTINFIYFSLPYYKLFLFHQVYH